jgi:hypothetical protein
VVWLTNLEVNTALSISAFRVASPDPMSQKYFSRTTSCIETSAQQKYNRSQSAKSTSSEPIMSPSPAMHRLSLDGNTSTPRKEGERRASFDYSNSMEHRDACAETCVMEDRGENRSRNDINSLRPSHESWWDCNWICPVTRYLVMSRYKFLLPSDDCQCARDDIYRLVLVLFWYWNCASILWSSVLVDLVNGRWRCWRMSGGCFSQNRPGTGVAAEISARPQRVKSFYCLIVGGNQDTWFQITWHSCRGLIYFYAKLLLRMMQFLTFWSFSIVWSDLDEITKLK